jgi:hypothetical protein
MYKLLYIIIFFSILSCSSSKISTNSAKSKLEKQQTDSLILVQSLPVYINSTDSLFEPSIRAHLQDSLEQSGFQFKSKNEVNALLQEFMNESAGVNNTEKMLQVIEKIKQDKEYFLKLAERADPYVQSITFKPCGIASKKCIIIERTNPPNYRKKKSWVFEYKEADKSGKLIKQIIEALTAQTKNY